MAIIEVMITIKKLNENKIDNNENETNDHICSSTKLKDGLGSASVADLPFTSISSRSKVSGIIYPDTETLLHLKVNDEDYDSNYESGEELPATCSDSDGKKSIWRIFKAAIPFQVREKLTILSFVLSMITIAANIK